MILKNVEVLVSQTRIKQPLKFFWIFIWGRSSDLLELLKVVWCLFIQNLIHKFTLWELLDKVVKKNDLKINKKWWMSVAVKQMK